MNKFKMMFLCVLISSLILFGTALTAQCANAVKLDYPTLNLAYPPDLPDANVDQFMSNNVLTALSMTIEPNALSLFKKISIQSYSVALMEIEVIRKFKASLGIPLLSKGTGGINFSNEFGYSLTMTNGNPKAYLLKYLIDQQSLVDLIDCVSNEYYKSNGLFFKLPREIDYYPKIQYSRNRALGGGITINTSALSGSYENKQTASFSRSFQERTDDDYFGFYFFRLDLSKLKNMAPLRVKDHCNESDVHTQTPSMKYDKKQNSITIGDAYEFISLSNTNFRTQNLSLLIADTYAIVPICCKSCISNNIISASEFLKVFKSGIVAMGLPAKKPGKTSGTEVMPRILDHYLFSLEMQPRAK